MPVLQDAREFLPYTLLTYYKGQGSVEGGFRFLQNKSFRVAEIFYKKEFAHSGSYDDYGALSVHLFDD